MDSERPQSPQDIANERWRRGPETAEHTLDRAERILREHAANPHPAATTEKVEAKIRTYERFSVEQLASFLDSADPGNVVDEQQVTLVALASIIVRRDQNKRLAESNS